jgi:exonuclease 3'-5' domain-containing protein 1
MADEILKYCEQDVMLMPRLLAVYGGKLQAGVAAQLQGIVDERIRLSKTDTFNGQGRHMAVGPHLAPTR